MRIKKTLARTASLLAVLVLGTACTSMDHYREKDPDPNHRLNKLLTAYEKATADGGACLELWRVDSATIDCSRIHREVERLYAEYPRNPRILMTNAVLNYEAGQKEKAQFLLDELLAQYGAHPDAAILRAHIALEEGNTRLARDLLERQIQMSPDRADLREALAAAYYIEGKYDTSRVVLGIAGRLGAPGWRLSYHHGLLCEAEMNWEEACRFYNTALEQKADYLPAQSRLIGLSQHKECREQTVLSSPAPTQVAPVLSVPSMAAAVRRAEPATFASVAFPAAAQQLPGSGVEVRAYVAAGDEF